MKISILTIFFKGVKPPTSYNLQTIAVERCMVYNNAFESQVPSRKKSRLANASTAGCSLLYNPRLSSTCAVMGRFLLTVILAKVFRKNAFAKRVP